MYLEEISLLIIVLAKLNHSLNSSEFCLLDTDQTECLTSDKQDLSLTSLVYKYECEKKYCSTSKTSCDRFQFLQKNPVFLSKKLRFSNQKYAPEYFSFLRSIKNCSSYLNTWNSADVCQNGLNCYSKHQLPLRYLNMYFIKPASCPCRNTEYEVQCGKEYCAIDQKTCDLFIQKLKYTPNKQLNVNECEPSQVKPDLEI